MKITYINILRTSYIKKNKWYIYKIKLLNYKNKLNQEGKKIKI